MKIRPTFVHWLIALLVIASVAMGGYILTVYLRTSSPAQQKAAAITIPPLNSGATTTPGRATVTLGDAPSSVASGSAWNIGITSNAWSKCSVDVYQPNDQPFAFQNAQDAQATMVSAGKFTWTWNVSPDAQKGTWTIRVLCGTFDNLATADKAVEVK